MRGPNNPDHEWQERARKIRAAARRGRNATEIAETYQVPVAMVARVLAHADHPRLSDPIELIRTGQVCAGKAPADVQLYWCGFLTAAGQIKGQGSSLTLVVTLGRKPPDSIGALPADLMGGHIRCEFCRSSIVGWQGYVRDPALCKALVPWGIPSDLDGNDPGVLSDLPAEFVAPFLRGFVDGDRVSRKSHHHTPRDGSFTVMGASEVLASIHTTIKKCWKVSGGIVTHGSDGAELRFADPGASRIIQHWLSTVPSRLA